MNDFLSRYYEEYCNIVEKFEENNSQTIPFCAAEPIISPFTKKPLSSSFSDRYIKSGVRSFQTEKQFIGSEYIFPLYEMVQELCGSLYSSDLADPRPLSGMNAAISSLMSITEQGDKVLYLDSESGGHGSFKEVLRRLGLVATKVPFNHEFSQYNVEEINTLIESGEYRSMFLAPSDLITTPPFEKFSSAENFHIIYDCTQSLGFLASGHHDNPLNYRTDTVLLGGTHKTLAGPTTGLVMAKNGDLADQLESRITPYFVRNPQPNSIAALVFTLMEFKAFGKEFMKKTLCNANYFASCLESEGFKVIKPVNVNKSEFTETHQVMLSLTLEETERLDKAARRLNISLDRKHGSLYHGYGVRLGAQAITRLGWDNQMIKTSAQLLWKLAQGDAPESLRNVANSLRGKSKCYYCIEEIN